MAQNTKQKEKADKRYKYLIVRDDDGVVREQMQDAIKAVADRLPDGHDNISTIVRKYIAPNLSDILEQMLPADGWKPTL